MSESASIAQTGFIDSNRFRRGTITEPVYVRRKAESYRPRVIRDINSPDYTPSRQIRRSDHNLANIRQDNLVATNLINPVQTVAAETLQPLSPTDKINPNYFKAKIYNFLKPNSRLQLAATVLALLIIVAGMYLSLLAWQNNQTVHAQAVKLTAEANKVVTTGTGSTSNASPAIATVKPTAPALAAYAVAPNYPKYLKIPSIGVDAEVGQVGLLANGALGTPDNVYNTDWYTGSAEPGQPGATLIDGHVSSWTADGVFYNLHKLVAGDSIRIVKGDNSVVNYQVVSTQVYNSTNVDMQAAITPIVSGVSGLNLITCTGQVIKGTSQFNQRIIVFAKEV